MSLTFKNNLPFDDTMDRNLKEQLDRRIDKHFPSVLIVDGPQGCGKTTFDILAMDRINFFRGYPPVKLEVRDHPQLSMGGLEFIKNFNICKQEGYSVCAYDEAGDFSRRGSLTSFNYMINRRLDTARGSNMVIILSLPNSNILDNYLFDQLQIVRGLIHITRASPNYSDYAVYDLQQIKWIRYWFEKLPKAIKHQCYDKVIPNFRGHFLNLDSVRKVQLAKISNIGKDKASQMTEIKTQGYLGIQDLAHKLEPPRSLIWVRKVLSELNIKHERLIERKKYYDKQVLQQIQSYLNRKRNWR